MAELNSYEYATNDLSKDPLRALDLSNDVQLLVDRITKNPNGEEQRADKNFKHLMDIEGYKPKEVVYNAATNIAPDLLAGLGKPIYHTVKNVPKTALHTPNALKRAGNWIKNVLRKNTDSNTVKNIKNAIVEAKDVDIKPLKNNTELKNIKNVIGEDLDWEYTKDAVLHNEALAETNKAVREVQPIRGKNDLAETFLESFPKEDISKLKDDEYSKLLSAIPDRQDREVAEAIKELEGIRADALAIPNEERKTIGDIIRDNNEIYRRNQERLNTLLKENRLSPQKKFELDQLNKLNYHNATNPYINDYLVKDFKKGGKFKTIPEYDAVRPYRTINPVTKKGLNANNQKLVEEALKFFNIPETTNAIKKNKGKIALYAAIKGGYRGLKGFQNNLRDEVIVPALADMVHLDLDNPNRYNQKDIEGTWEILKRDWDNKEHPLPENPTPRQMIRFIKEWVPKDKRKDIFAELSKGKDIEAGWEMYKKATDWSGDDSKMTIEDKDKILSKLSPEDAAELTQMVKDKDKYAQYDHYRELFSKYFPDYINENSSYKDIDNFINRWDDDDRAYVKELTGEIIGE